MFCFFFYLSIHLSLFSPSDKTHLLQGPHLFPQVSSYLVQCHPLPLFHVAAFPHAESVFTKLSGFHAFPAAHPGEIKALAI